MPQRLLCIPPEPFVLLHACEVSPPSLCELFECHTEDKRLDAHILFKPLTCADERRDGRNAASAGATARHGLAGCRCRAPPLLHCNRIGKLSADATALALQPKDGVQNGD